MTNEDRAEFIAAFNAGITGRFDPANPASPIARLKAAWSEASEFERAAFRMEISEERPAFGSGDVALMIAAAD